MTASATDSCCFDVSGYRVVRGALTREQAATYNTHLDALAPESIADRDERETRMQWAFNIHRDPHA